MANNRVGIPKYYIKEDWKFNLESSYEKLHVWLDEWELNDVKPPEEILGKQINTESDLEELISEIETLNNYASFGKVTGKEYGRIKEIVQWRCGVRYVTCLASGMSEQDAGMCFADI